MTDLTPRQESFCQAYAAEPNGAEAARSAGYAAGSARQRASALLTRPEIAARVAELQAETAASDAERRAALAAKLDPCYRDALDAKDIPSVIQLVDEQARIQSFVHGAPAIQMKLTAAPATRDHENDRDTELRLERLENRLTQIARTIDYLRLKAQGYDVDGKDVGLWLYRPTDERGTLPAPEDDKT